MMRCAAAHAASSAARTQGSAAAITRSARATAICMARTPSMDYTTRLYLPLTQPFCPAYSTRYQSRPSTWRASP